jgi:acyl carrier protein
MMENRLSHEQIADQVRQMIAEQMEINEHELTPEVKIFETLGMDSLDAIDLAIACKRKFGLELKESDMREVRTLADIYSMVQKGYDNKTATH